MASFAVPSGVHARQLDQVTERSRKFYDGTYKWFSQGFQDEEGVYHEFADTEDDRPPTPLPPPLVCESDSESDDSRFWTFGLEQKELLQRLYHSQGVNPIRGDQSRYDSSPASTVLFKQQLYRAQAPSPPILIDPKLSGDSDGKTLPREDLFRDKDTIVRSHLNGRLEGTYIGYGPDQGVSLADAYQKVGVECPDDIVNVGIGLQGAGEPAKPHAGSPSFSWCSGMTDVSDPPSVLASPNNCEPKKRSAKGYEGDVEMSDAGGTERPTTPINASNEQMSRPTALWSDIVNRRPVNGNGDDGSDEDDKKKNKTKDDHYAQKGKEKKRKKDDDEDDEDGRDDEDGHVSKKGWKVFRKDTPQQETEQGSTRSYLPYTGTQRKDSVFRDTITDDELKDATVEAVPKVTLGSHESGLNKDKTEPNFTIVSHDCELKDKTGPNIVIRSFDHELKDKTAPNIVIRSFDHELKDKTNPKVTIRSHDCELKDKAASEGLRECENEDKTETPESEPKDQCKNKTGSKDVLGSRECEIRDKAEAPESNPENQCKAMAGCKDVLESGECEIKDKTEAPEPSSKMKEAKGRAETEPSPKKKGKDDDQPKRRTVAQKSPRKPRGGKGGGRGGARVGARAVRGGETPKSALPSRSSTRIAIAKSKQ